MAIFGSESDFPSPYGSSDSIVPPLPGSVSDLLVAVQNSQGPTVVQLPWQLDTAKGANLVPSVFFPYVNIDPTRWDQLFPYRLLVIDVTDQNKIVNSASGYKSDDPLKITVRKGTDTSLIEITNFGTQWVFELPISPQQLNIQDMFAINTSATLRGVIEEHNGVKFKMINASGTLGVWPQRSSVVKPPSSPNVLQSVFGGTLEAFGNLVDSVQKVINTATTGSAANKPDTTRPESIPNGIITTGYYNAMKLQQFLEQYAEAKKNPANAGWRLVFDIPKQNQSYIVTPMQYTWQQSQAKSMEILFSFQLKAWRRVDLNENPAVVPSGVSTLTPGILQRVMNTIFTAREATSSAINLIAAVRSDVEAPLDALRQTAMFVKDLAGVVLTAADLPSQIQSDYKNAIAQVMQGLSINSLTGTASTDPAVTRTLKALQTSLANNEGLSLDAVSAGQLGTTAAQYQSTDPAQNLFTNPQSNFALMDQVNLNSLKLTNAQQNAVNNAIAVARATTVDDLKQFRATIQTLALQLSNNFGSGDAFVSQVYNLPTPAVRVTPITIDDYELLKALYDVMQVYDLLTASTQVDDTTTLSSMEYVAGLADQSGIPFSIPNSKIMVPVPFGLTVEGIASRYLADPQRWIEIVTLNNLRDPYIDENGFQLPLLSNGNGRNVTIADASNLFLGQKVIVQSANQTPSPRSILGIDKLSDTSFLLTLDGLPNLDNFTTANLAYIQAYLPGTVNSQQKIFIPSNTTVSDDPTVVIPTSASADPLSGLSKVDLLLTDTGDLAVNNFGDFRYAYGMTNIIQALKIKFSSISGTILLHPEFGLGVRPGTINSTIQVQEIFNQVNQMIKADSRFSGINNLQILLNGPTLSINIQVVLAGTSGVFPLTFDLTG